MAYKWYLMFIFAQVTLGDLRNKRINIFENVKSSRMTSECNNTLEMYIQNLRESPPDDSWALKMLDATSKIPVGILYSYNFGELGNFKQCLETESNDKTIKAKYCVGSIYINMNISSTQLIDPIQEVSLRHISRVMNNLQSEQSRLIPYPSWSICLPSNCTDGDILELANNNDLLGLQFLSFTCQTTEDINQPLNVGAILTLIFLALIVGIMILSTIYEVHCINNNTVPVHVLFTAFSIYSNGKKLFSANKLTSEISCLNGLRFLSIVWVVSGHTFSVYTSGPVSNLKDAVDWANSLQSMIMVNGILSVDSFLVVGGALVVYVFMKAKQQGIRFNIFHYYIHRYIRLTPAFAAAILVSATLLEYMGSGPRWIYIKSDFANNCKVHWWSALLYVQNYVNVNKMCLGQTWYLDIDMQLYIVSPLILYLLWKYHKIGITLVIMSIIVFIIVPFYIAYKEELSGLITNFYPKTPYDTYMNNLYLKTHTRAAPWLIGVLLGYLLSDAKFKNVKNYRMNKKTAILAWLICFSVMFTCILGGHSTLRTPDYDRLGNAFYIALIRPTWAVCVAWVIWACAMDYGGPINTFLSLSIFQILNRFTYSIYLLHVTMLYMIVFSSKTSIYFTIFNMAYLFWGIFMFSFGLSIVWVLAFESPMISIEKYMFKSRK